ncbi:hypothetical protein LCGC14_1342380 [marine sediment metagenome]|uniref:Uncharacterized protein n=1 Tax=marine sediment metagenome TaxID=412755 RepID=A0A0F9MU63_9ZZZZ
MSETEEVEEKDNSFIKIVSRNHPIFKNRGSILYSMQNGKLNAEKLPTVPDNVIICDGCNELIKDEEVGLLMLEPNRCWGTQCKNCRVEHFSELPVVRE